MSDRLAKRVLLIGWDAADWQMIDPIMARGQMPNLRRFLDEGVRASIATLNPIISPILWNSIATGKRADKHDILGFVEPDGKGFIRPVSSTSRRAKAIWNILSQNGLRSAVVGWYASYPAEHINGVIVTDRYQHAHTTFGDKLALDERAAHPESVLETLADLKVGINDITGDQAVAFIPEIQSIDHEKDPYPAALAQLLAECSTIHNAATWLIEHETWDFMAVYYDAVDHFGHGFMEFHPPRMDHVSDEDFRRYQHVMTSAYRFHDLMLGRLLELAGPETTVIILSDHGFQNGNMRPRLFKDPQTGRKHGAGLNPIAWHRPFGVLAARGPGIRKGEEVNSASLLDICPTILTLLGLPVARDMDGAVLTQIFDRPPPVRTIPSYEPPHPDDGVHREHVEDDPYAAQEVLKQLVELGYLAAPTEDQEATVRAALRDRRSALAQVHYSAGRIAEATAVLQELAAEFPTPEFKTRLAMCLVAQDRFPEVEPLLSELAGDPSQAPVATLLYAQMRFGQGRPEEAAELLQRVIDFGVRFPQLHTQMGRIRLRQSRWEDARAAFERAIEVDADDSAAHDGLGVALRQLGRAEDAVFHHMKAISLEHTRAESHINLGIALSDCKKLDWAIRAFEVAIELAPESPFPHRCLYQLYKRGKKDQERATRHIRRAIELRSRAMTTNQGRFLQREGWSL